MKIEASRSAFAVVVGLILGVLATIAASAPVRAAGPKAYKVERLALYDLGFERKLNERATEGWELVQIETTATATLLIFAK